MLALYPGQNIPACHVLLHGISPGDGAAVAVHATCYPFEIDDTTCDCYRSPPTYPAVLVPASEQMLEEHIASWSADAQQEARREARLLHRRARDASIVSEVIYDDAPPALALDRLIRRYPFATAYASIIDQCTCLAAIRVNGPDPGSAPCGYAVTMRAAEPVRSAGFGAAPVTLYAALLLGWARWWILGARDLTERSVGLEDLPPPPLALDLVEAWQVHRVMLEGPERVTWHSPTPPRRPETWPHGDEGP